MASDTANNALRPSRPAPWRDPRVRGIFLQIVFVAVLAAIVAFLVHNTVVNLRQRGIAGGFGFLGGEASFGIGESLIEYSPADTYWRAFLVGLTNTLYVSAIGIVLATIVGTVMGLARLSSNWLVAKLAQIYVETFRNIPLALQLLFWWALLRGLAPAPRQAWQPLPGAFISNRGSTFPVPFAGTGHRWRGIAFGPGLVITFAVRRWAKRRQERTGQQFPTGWAGLGLALGLPAIVFIGYGLPLRLDVPALRGFNFAGGTAMSPEFGALLIGLVVYTGTFIAHILRPGILAVSWGQSEAAMALGLRPGQRMGLVVLPQALVVILPPVPSHYL